MKKTALRTHDACFNNLPGYNFQPRYIMVSHHDYEPLRLHYVDEGITHNNATPSVLLLHGCPTWSYLYRNVITSLQQTSAMGSGFRILAPDWIGCGKSDKLLHRSDYHYDTYVQWLRQFIEQLDLRNITLVGQDWGGPIGLRVLSELPERFSRVLLTNTLLPNAEPPPHGVEPWPSEQINQWVQYTARSQDLAIGQVVQGSCHKKLTADVIAAYDAPFPDATYKHGMLGWPSLIPLTTHAVGILENHRVWQFLEQSNIPLMTAFSDRDPSTILWERVFQRRAAGAQGRIHRRITNAGHMVQEDQGALLAHIIYDFMQTG